jgi:hypothetical protein
MSYSGSTQPTSEGGSGGREWKEYDKDDDFDDNKKGTQGGTVGSWVAVHGTRFTSTMVRPCISAQPCANAAHSA